MKPDIFKENWIDRKTKKQADCEHLMYQKICSCCGKILCSEKTDEEGIEIKEVLINSK